MHISAQSSSWWWCHLDQWGKNCKLKSLLIIHNSCSTYLLLKSLWVLVKSLKINPRPQLKTFQCWKTLYLKMGRLFTYILLLFMQNDFEMNCCITFCLQFIITLPALQPNFRSDLKLLHNSSDILELSRQEKQSSLIFMASHEYFSG